MMIFEARIREFLFRDSTHGMGQTPHTDRQPAVTEQEAAREQIRKFVGKMEQAYPDGSVRSFQISPENTRRVRELLEPVGLAQTLAGPFCVRPDIHPVIERPTLTGFSIIPENPCGITRLAVRLDRNIPSVSTIVGYHCDFRKGLPYENFSISGTKLGDPLKHHDLIYALGQSLLPQIIP